MAGLENLVPIIYHEKQQSGSMLCAQHALNSLLRAYARSFDHTHCLIYGMCGPLQKATTCVPEYPPWQWLLRLIRCSQFTTPDLSAIAASLDALEVSYNTSAAGTSSTNMDDTGLPHPLFSGRLLTSHLGFFSVQVLENALDVWGLRYVSCPLATIYHTIIPIPLP